MILTSAYDIRKLTAELKKNGDNVQYIHKILLSSIDVRFDVIIQSSVN